MGHLRGVSTAPHALARPVFRGFTLPELLVVVAIVGLLAALAVPALAEAIARHRLRAAAGDLLDGLRKARSVAVWRGDETVVCASRDGRSCHPTADWAWGWIGRARERGDTFASARGPDGRLAALRRGGRHEVRFLPNGTSPGTNQKIVLCLRGRPATALTVSISNAGLVRLAATDADDAARCAANRSRTR
jgi:type IV fimbrial biogenesis protein FimT